MGKVIILVLAGIAAVAVIAFATAKRKKGSSTATIYGEVIDIFKDETGLTCITVKDHKKNVETGVSNLSVSELEMLYKGKGFVQIPVIRKL